MKQFKNYFAIISLILFILSSLAVASKIDKHLELKMQNMDSDEKISVLVFMRDQAELDQVSGNPRKVLQRLKEVAEKSQAKVEISTMRTQLNSQGQSKILQYKSFWVVNCISVTGTKDAIYQLSKTSDVDRIIEDPVIPLPSPTVSTDSESILNNVQWNISKIGADRVWRDFGYRGEGIVVGCIDTGVSASHPDLVDKMAHIGNGEIGWFDAVNGSGTPSELSDVPHGTHVIGTIVGGNLSGSAIGVAPDAKYYMAKAFTSTGATGTDILECAQWMMDPDGNPETDDFPDVINCSWGGNDPNNTWFEAMHRSWEAMGIFSAFAAGNSGPASGTIGDPAGYPEAFAVGATTSTDEIANFSSRGPVDWQDKAGINPPARTVIKPDISAPGSGIKSTVPGGYSSWNGTSMATPHITATAALIRQAHPQIRVEELKRILADSSVDLGASGKDNNYGYGRVSAYGAVSSVVHGGTLAGVVSGDGQGVSSALVEAEKPQELLSTKTNANGQYSLLLPAGTYTVRVSKVGYVTSEISDVVIESGRTTTLNIGLVPVSSGVVRGTVTDINNSQPLAATVTALSADISDNTDPSTGEYSIRLPEGEYELSATADGYRTQTASVAITADDTITRDFALEPYDSAEPNDDFDSAYLISIGVQISADINPAGDLDFYSFEGEADESISIDIDAGSLSPSSKLDSVLSLYDRNRTLIAENDDYDDFDSRIDGFNLPYTGVYYIRVKSFWDSEGGEDYFYVLKIEPSAPRNLRAASGLDGRVVLEWDSVVDVDYSPAPQKARHASRNTHHGYNVYRSETPNVEVIEDNRMNSEPVTATIYTDENVVNGTTYYYVVTAVFDTGETGPSNEVSARPGLLDAYEPNDDFANAYEISFFDVISNATVDPQGDEDYFSFTGIAGQRIRAYISARSLEPPSQLNSIMYLYNANQEIIAQNDDYNEQDSLVEATLPEDGHYYIKVESSQSAGGEDYFYNLILVTIGPANLQAQSGLDGHVILTWKDNFSQSGSVELKEAFIGYNVYRSTQPGVPAGDSAYRLNQNPITGSSYDDTDVVNGTTYYYVVTTVYESGESKPEGEVSAYPGAADPYEPNNDFDHAKPINYDELITATTIAPAGDLDFFKFTGMSGLLVTIDVSARSLEPPSKLDSVLTLYDANSDEISYNDDFDGRDSRIEYFKLTQNETYYIKVEDYYADGGENYNYALKLERCGPSNLQAQSGLDGLVKLTWDPIVQVNYNPAKSQSQVASSSPPGIAYNVYRGESPGVEVTEENRINTEAVEDTSYNDTELINGERYYYVVTALINGEETAPSNEVNARPGLADSYEPNDEFETAYEISFGQTVENATIDPPGDLDYFSFTGRQAQLITVDVDAEVLQPPSELDSTLTLFDSNYNEIAYNDDFDGYDSRIEQFLPRDGIYYIKVEPFYRSNGGEDFFYNLVLETEISLNLRAQSGDGHVQLRWDAVSQVNYNPAKTQSENYAEPQTLLGYNVYRSDLPDLPLDEKTRLNATPIKENSYDDTSVKNGQTYFYVVTAVFDTGESAPSNEVAATPGAPDPYEPNDNMETATGISYGAPLDNAKIKPSGEEDWYKFKGYQGQIVTVETVANLSQNISMDVALFNSDGNKLAWSEMPELIIEDFQLLENAMYYIRVSGEILDEIDTSDSRIPYSTHLDLSPPKNLTAESGLEGRISLSWTSPLSQDETSVSLVPASELTYNVYRREFADSFYKMINGDQPIAGTSFDDTEVENGLTYYYVVTAVYGNIESRHSNEALGRSGVIDPNEPNNGINTATRIEIGQKISSAVIQSTGDEDYYVFSASEGQGIIIDIDARVNGSKLDSMLILYDRDGETELAVNDDFDGYDSRVEMSIPHDGAYYAKVSGFDGGFGPGYYYAITVKRPDSPTDLQATGQRSDILLQWESPIGVQFAPAKETQNNTQPQQIIGYNIYRGNVSGKRNKVNSDLVAETFWTDSDVTEGTKYFYAVTAVYENGESGYSNETSASTVPFGDVDGKNGVTIDDATLVMQHVVGLTTLTGDAYNRADVSGNGDVTSYDAALIIQRVRGIIETFPVDLED